MAHLYARRIAPALVILAALAAPLAAQVAPTLPRDTLFGRKLPPESSVPRGAVAPTLPRDTLGGRALPPTTSVPRRQTPTFPSDSLAPAKMERNRADSLARIKPDSGAAKPAAAAAPKSKPTIRRAKPRRHP